MSEFEQRYLHWFMLL